MKPFFAEQKIQLQTLLCKRRKNLQTFPTFARQMQKEQSISKSGLRFTKWSRKSYAVFLTIGREVTIGVLAVQLCLRLSTKIIQGIKNTILQLDDQEEEVGLEEEQMEMSSSFNRLLCFLGIDFRNLCNLDPCLLKADIDKGIQKLSFFFLSFFSFFARFLKRHFTSPSGNFSITLNLKTKINEFENSIDGYCCLPFLCGNCFCTRR